MRQSGGAIRTTVSGCGYANSPQVWRRGSGTWLRITPAPGRAAPVRERIIKSPARRTPDPVSRDARPQTASPPAGRTIRPPAPRAVPLAGGTACSPPVTVPAVRHWMPARTITIPYSHNSGRRTRCTWPRGRSQRPGLRRYRGGQSKPADQHQSKNAHLGLPRASATKGQRLTGGLSSRTAPTRRTERSRSSYGVLCSPAPTRGSGSSSRTWNAPPIVSTFAPAHHPASTDRRAHEHTRGAWRSTVSYSVR